MTDVKQAKKSRTELAIERIAAEKAALIDKLKDQRAKLIQKASEAQLKINNIAADLKKLGAE